MSLNCMTQTLAALSLIGNATDGAAPPAMPTLLGPPVANITLQQMRGGFVLDNGMIVDIQVHKHLFLNGQPTAESYFTSQQTDLASVAGKPLTTIIQNTLNDQVLTSLTQVDITVSNLAPVQHHLAQTVMFETMFNGALNN